ncbi:APC family permease [Mycolicibacterium wolinskyi]|uniref:Amino acid permease n=1 Tax=Mycolicibacterium wolinskyi TaxID=59750 RepID=A0A1X2F1K4_9MYCO|nr:MULTISPECIES: APC family permease [Mycolicibacterium]MCV7287957.1 APC family permease [Mycolicibacterium wolinskyi]MCV7294855.1 APC family permease [Mycolicibacterium goodii]ORX12302.1 amino acid permease [Mycolicibacterium wolinskyi]
MTTSATPESDQLPHRRLPFWVALALSVATVGPTLAMSGNGQGLIGTVGKAIPLVFLIGLIGVSLVGYSFVRLTRHLNHAGSAYALVGGTVGPRAGFFSGFAMLGAYVGFSIGTLALTAAFTNAFIAQLQPASDNPYQLPWLVVVVIGAVISFALAGRDIRLLAKILLGIEGIGIVAMVVLVVVIFARGGAETTGIDFSVFSFSGGGVSAAAVLSGVVAAFLSWAGFEACASMGEETDNPGRNIPRALAGTLILTGVLFVVVMFAQVIGFGTDEAGLAAFQSSGNTLGDLGSSYIGQWFSLLIIFTATVAAFGCHMATAATSGRMLYAFGRDGFGPKSLAHIHEATGGPRRASWLVVGLALVINLICGAIGWPDMGTGNDAIDTYFLFAVAGSVCLMVCYLLVEIAAAWFVGAPKFVDVHGGHGKVLGLALPLLGAVVIAVVLWFNVKDAETWTAAPLLGLYWCAVGLVIALAASGIAKRVGESLTAELALTPPVEVR